MRNKLIIVLALQVIWLVATAAMYERKIQSGQVVHLETVPVDPRDLLRGDYVILRYKISTIDPSRFILPLPDKLSGGERIYVVLEKRGAFHEVVQASLSPMQPYENQVVMIGRANNNANTQGGVRVEYGLEQYFVPEKQGNLQGKVSVDAAVSKNGEPVIKTLFLDEKPWIRK